MAELALSARGEGRSAPASSRAGYTLRDILIFAFYSWRAILIGALIPLLIGGVAAVATEKQYSSSGLLLVLVNREHSGSENISGTGPSVLSIEGLKLVQSEAEILASDSVLTEVVKSVGPDVLYPELGRGRLFGLLPPYEAAELPLKAVEKLRRHLKADVVDESSVIRLTFRHPNPELAATVAAAIIRTYEAQRRQVYDVVRSPLLNVETQRFAAELSGIDAQIDTVKKKYGVLDIAQDALLAQNQSDILLQRTRQAQERRAAVNRQVEVTQAQLDALPRKLFDFTETTNQIINDDDGNQLTKLQLELQGLRRYYQPDYPLIAQVEKKIDQLKASIEEKHGRVYTSNRDVRNPTVDFITNRLMQLQVERDALDDQIAELGRLSVEAAKRFDTLRDAQSTLHELERTRKVMEDVYHDYRLRAEAVSIDEKAAASQASNVRIVEMPQVPVTGESLAWSFLAAGIFGGLLTGAAAGVAANWNRQVFLLPGEAERRLGMPALASFMIGKPKPNDRASDEELSHLASQILDTRVGDRGLSVVQLLPVSDWDNEAEVVRGLIAECAERRGIHMLLVDLTDGQRMAKAVGIRRGGAPSNDVAGLTVTAVPGWPAVDISLDGPSSRAFAMRSSMQDALASVAALRDAYGLILVASPPLAQSHVGRRVAAVVDATVMLLQAESTRSPAAAWSRETVLEAGGDLLGFIMSGRRFHIPSRIYKWL